MTGPTWNPSQGEDPKPDTITDAIVCLRTVVYQLNETNANTPKYWIEVRDPFLSVSSPILSLYSFRQEQFLVGTFD